MTNGNGEFSSSDQVEAAARRFTSEKVLITGVEKGWADTEHPRDIDFSLRPSVFGELEFDYMGRPLNPMRTPVMPGDRGELGKWGVNYTADPVVIAIDPEGNMRILLIQRETGEWALPGGMVEKGDNASETLKRELDEESGVNLDEYPALPVFQGYVNDPRNTRNAWTETRAELIVIDHTPAPNVIEEETLDARWFRIITVEDLKGQITQLGSTLYASHDVIIRYALNVLDETPDRLRYNEGMLADIKKLKGVNLGGWLILEKWMTPSLFNNTNAQDEYSLYKELGDKKYSLIKEHRKTFITKNDFKWLAEQGFNAVRIPIGYWLFADEDPYVGHINELDWAMEQARLNGLKVLVDFHAAPGSQNGAEHSGKAGDVAWHTQHGYIHRSLDTIERLANRYGGHEALWGIEVLNEPHHSIPLDTLIGYYQDTYAIIRSHCSRPVQVVLCDGFRLKQVSDRLARLNLSGAVIDTHLYQLYSESERRLSVDGHIGKAKNQWSKDIANTQEHMPLVIGEWTARLNNETLAGLTGQQVLAAETAYGQVQQQVFEAAIGWFYWNYKTEGADCWNARWAIEHGVITV